jgi:hypothetical protein
MRISALWLLVADYAALRMLLAELFEEPMAAKFAIMAAAAPPCQASESQTLANSKPPREIHFEAKRL